MDDRARRNLIVLGGTGLLGAAVEIEARKRGWAVAGPPRSRLDLERPETIEAALSALGPQAVVNAAAFTDVTGAEDPRVLSRVVAVNRTGPAALAEACEARGIELVHVSTDYVFDGLATEPYGEEAAVGPLQVYGRTKREGEIEVLARAPRAIVARTSTLFGPGRRSRPHYVDSILAQAEAGGRIEVVEPPRASPTYTPDLAAMLLELIDVRARGIVHAVNDGSCSRLELARAAVEEANLEGRVEIVARDVPTRPPARPAFAALDVTRLERWVGWRPRPWREALREYVRGWGKRTA